MDLDKAEELELEPDDHESSAVTLIHGRRLGQYRLCFELAKGGMATVHLARAEGRAGMSRFVAIKQIHAHLAKDPTFVEMFRDEVQLASRIGHVNVCGVLDYSAAEGAPWLVMEYLVGEPLSHVRTALTRRSSFADVDRDACCIARVMADVCEGLHAVHELRDEGGEPLQVVHRDVSPGNLFLTFDGVVKVVDFGVAKAARRSHKTRTGIVKGKVAYLSPEVLAGKASDRRADVWGAGVVLWELLTRARLFRRENDTATLMAICKGEIPPPSEVQLGIDPELDRITLRALTRDPEARYATAREMGRDLIRFLGLRGEPVGLADLAEWMDNLFPGGRACKQQLLDIAGQLPVLTDDAPARPAIASVPDALTAERLRQSERPAAPPNAAPETPTSSESRTIPPSRAWPRRTVLVSAGASLVAAAIALAAPRAGSLLESIASSSDRSSPQAPVVKVAPTPPPAQSAPAPEPSMSTMDDPPRVAEPDARPPAVRVGNGPYVLEIEQDARPEGGFVVRVRQEPDAAPRER